MNRPLFTMLVGLPATGKSTYCAQALERHPGTVILSTDAYVEARAAELGASYNDLWGSMIKEAEADMWETFGRAYRARQSIIVDRTNLTVKARRKFMATMSPSLYHRLAVVFELPEEVRERRAAGRPEKVISPEVIERMREWYVPPTLSEGFDAVVSHHLPFEVAA